MRWSWSRVTRRRAIAALSLAVFTFALWFWGYPALRTAAINGALRLEIDQVRLGENGAVVLRTTISFDWGRIVAPLRLFCPDEFKINEWAFQPNVFEAQSLPASLTRPFDERLNPGVPRVQLPEPVYLCSGASVSADVDFCAPGGPLRHLDRQSPQCVDLRVSTVLGGVLLNSKKRGDGFARWIDEIEAKGIPVGMLVRACTSLVPEYWFADTTPVYIDSNPLGLDPPQLWADYDRRRAAEARP